jgi:hypothetical protein
MEHRQRRSHDMDQSPARTGTAGCRRALTWLNGFPPQEAPIARSARDSRRRRDNPPDGDTTTMTDTRIKINACSTLFLAAATGFAGVTCGKFGARQNYEAMLKLADYQADEFATDTTKLWLQFAAAF